MYQQVEIRIVIFEPNPGWFAADVYANRQGSLDGQNGRRILCGRAARDQQTALENTLHNLSSINRMDPMLSPIRMVLEDEIY
jgi:hypothetical protein